MSDWHCVDFMILRGKFLSIFFLQKDGIFMEKLHGMNKEIQPGGSPPPQIVTFKFKGFLRNIYFAVLQVM